MADIIPGSIPQTGAPTAPPQIPQGAPQAPGLAANSSPVALQPATDQSPQAVQRRRGAWQQFLGRVRNDPGLTQLLLQTGLSLMRDRTGSSRDHLARSVQAGLRAQAITNERLEAGAREEDELDLRRQGLEQRVSSAEADRMQRTAIEGGRTRLAERGLTQDALFATQRAEADERRSNEVLARLERAQNSPDLSAQQQERVRLQIEQERIRLEKLRAGATGALTPKQEIDIAETALKQVQREREDRSISLNPMDNAEFDERFKELKQTLTPQGAGATARPQARPQARRSNIRPETADDLAFDPLKQQARAAVDRAGSVTNADGVPFPASDIIIGDLQGNSFPLFSRSTGGFIKNAQIQ